MRGAPRSRLAAAFAVLVAVAACTAAPAQANRALITEKAVKPEKTKVPEEQIEGACGVALNPTGVIYVSDYYHHLVEGFGGQVELIPAGTPPEGPCGLAFDSAGALYANIWHQRVVRLKPSPMVFDEDSSTGVAVDSAGNVYANDRTRIVKYSSSGTLIEEIGTGGLLEDAYGLAVFGGRVYVPDAASNSVKVFEPAKSAGIVEALEPPGGFTSLVDASVAVDPTNGHVLVVDNLQPGFEHPAGGIDEFDVDGDFLKQLKKTVIDGGPSGITVDGAGTLYVTSGNSEFSNVFSFSPYTESGPEAAQAPPEASAQAVAGPPSPDAIPAIAQGSAATAAARVERNRRHRPRRSHGRRAGLSRARAVS